MRKHFGMSKAFNGYPLIEVLIKAIGYRLSMVPFFLALAYHWGRRFNRLVAFSSFLSNKTQKLKTGLHADMPFPRD